MPLLDHIHLSFTAWPTMLEQVAISISQPTRFHTCPFLPVPSRKNPSNNPRMKYTIRIEASIDTRDESHRQIRTLERHKYRRLARNEKWMVQSTDKIDIFIWTADEIGLDDLEPFWQATKRDYEEKCRAYRAISEKLFDFLSSRA